MATISRQPDITEENDLIMADWKSRIVGQGSENPRNLIPNPKNWRKHPIWQRDALSGILDEVGWVQQVIINRRTGHVVDGHLRVELSAARGEDAVPVVYVDISEEEEKKILTVLDPITSLAEIDHQQLRTLLESTRTESEALDRLLIDLSKALSPEDDAKSKQQIKQRQFNTEHGQLWRVGKHHLWIGDSASLPTDVFSILPRIDGVASDPPYDLKTNKIIEILELLTNRSVLLIGDRQSHEISKYWRHCLTMIWIHRNRKIPTRNVPLITHTPIVVFTKGRTKSGWRKPTKNFTSVIKAEYENHISGYSKPVAVFEHMLAGFNWRYVVDPFAGLGACLLACERSGRRCLSVEKDPQQAAALLERAHKQGMRSKIIARF